MYFAPASTTAALLPVSCFDLSNGGPRAFEEILRGTFDNVAVTITVELDWERQCGI